MAGYSSASGMRQAAEPLAMKAGVRWMTGVLCYMGFRAASKALSMQAGGEAAASTGMGLSPLRP